MTRYVVHGRHGWIGDAGTLAKAKGIARTDARMPLSWKWQEVEGTRTYYSNGDYTITRSGGAS